MSAEHAAVAFARASFGKAGPVLADAVAPWPEFGGAADGHPGNAETRASVAATLAAAARDEISAKEAEARLSATMWKALGACRDRLAELYPDRDKRDIHRLLGLPEYRMALLFEMGSAAFDPEPYRTTRMRVAAALMAIALGKLGREEGDRIVAEIASRFTPHEIMADAVASLRAAGYEPEDD